MQADFDCDAAQMLKHHLTFKPGEVEQINNLPYRRLAIGSVWWIENRCIVLSGLTILDTASATRHHFKHRVMRPAKPALTQT